MPHYKLQIYIEFEAEDEEKAMDTTVSILTQPPHQFKEFKEFDVQLTDITGIELDEEVFKSQLLLMEQQ